MPINTPALTRNDRFDKINVRHISASAPVQKKATTTQKTEATNHTEKKQHHTTGWMNCEGQTRTDLVCCVSVYIPRMAAKQFIGILTHGDDDTHSLYLDMAPILPELGMTSISEETDLIDIIPATATKWPIIGDLDLSKWVVAFKNIVPRILRKKYVNLSTSKTYRQQGISIINICGAKCQVREIKKKLNHIESSRRMEVNDRTISC
jgi:hypothetical protein